MAELANQKPCLVQTTQGFSVLYNQKFLYSKYNPSKTILGVIDQLNILPGTIILCCSPLLDYGIKELYQKLPQNCLLLGCEQNPELREFAKENITLKNELILLTQKELYNLPFIINEASYTFDCGTTIEFSGNYRRFIRIDFSAGVQFNPDFYNELYNGCTSAIMTFWTNRITLTHFGHRYSKNFFTNLHNLEGTIPVENFFHSIDKPIIICGAGQSLDSAYKDFGHNRNSYYILCADTALQPLLSHNIEPDGVFIEEAQHVISKAFLATEKHNYHLFASLSSLPQLGKFLPKNRITYFTTLYTNSTFISSMEKKGIIPPSNKPFGSVGLTAVYYGLQFRKSSKIPVYLYGLDFSYSTGLTHAKQTLAHKTRLLTTNKLNPAQNYGASYNTTAYKILDKSNRVFFTTPVLENYSKIFMAFFANTENLYDSGDCGLPLEIPYKKPEPITNTCNTKISDAPYSEYFISRLNDYLQDERAALLELKDILTGKKELTKEEADIQIKKIVQNREYLFLHFPDGYKFNSTQAFLNRIRVEVDFFLKYI